jgi:hypothetical protein
MRTAMLAEGTRGRPVEAAVTIAALKPTDSPHSLLARVSGPESAAAE